MALPLIFINPEISLAHENVRIKIEKLKPNVNYTLHFNASNGLRLNADSILHFVSDCNGVIDLEKQKPLASSPNLYSNLIDSMSLFRVMRPR